MRVLLVVHGFPPRASGGTEIYVHDLAHALARLPEIDVFVLTRDSDPDRPEYAVREERIQDRLTVFRINNTFQACTSYEDSYTNPLFADVANALIDEIDPDIVHVQHLTCLSTKILEHASAMPRPIVMTLNDYWLMCHRGQLLTPDGQRCEGPFDGGCSACVPRGVLAGPTTYRVGRMARALPIPGAAATVRAASKLRELCTPVARAREASWARLQHLRGATRLVDSFLAPSATIESWASRFGIERERLRRCDQGIDLTPFSTISRTEGDRLRLAFVGSLIPSKAPHVLLEAAASLPANRVSVDLLGSTNRYHGDTRYLQRLAPLLGLPFVRKLGPVPHERIPDALANVDALVVPSEWIENAPFVIREAFAAKLPVIASNLGGMAEMVRHDFDGLLFAAGSVSELTTQITRLLDEPGLLRRLREAVRRPMSIEEDAAQLRAHYSDLVHGRPGRIRLRQRLRRDRLSERDRRPSNDERRDCVTAVVLNYRTPDETWLAVRSLETSTIRPTPIVVDNGSDDDSVERLSQMSPGTRVISTGENLGFSGGCNAGIRAALADGADFVLLVNSDVVLSPHALERLMAAADSHSRAGIVAPVLLSREEPDRIASAGIRFSSRTGRMRHMAAGQPLSLLPPAPAHSVDAVSGCVMLVRRHVFELVGLFDEAFFFSFEDIDFCLRARRAGFDVLTVPDAIAYHEGGRSIGRRSPERVYYAARNHLRVAEMADDPLRVRWLRGGLIVGLNAGYVLLSGETPRLQGLAALTRGVRHHLAGRYGPS